MLMLLTLLTDL